MEKIHLAKDDDDDDDEVFKLFIPFWVRTICFL